MRAVVDELRFVVEVLGFRSFYNPVKSYKGSSNTTEFTTTVAAWTCP